ncbi:MAG: cupin domain-containing protein [Candidatus Binatia bacterium]
MDKPVTMVDEVQIFDVGKTLKEGDSVVGRTDMARSPNSFVAVFQTKPRGGETHIHQHPDSDQILFVLKGELTVEGLTGKYALNPNQGVLIPAGVHYGFTNTQQEDLIFLSMRTESSGGRRVAYVKNVTSSVQLKIPAAALSGAKGLGRNIFVYAINRDTFGVSSLLHEDWNKGSLLRMNCDYQMNDGNVVAKLPERLVQWYKIDRLPESDYKLTLEPEMSRVRVELAR